MSDDQHDNRTFRPRASGPSASRSAIACILVGLVVSVPALIVGALITLVFGFLWMRDLMRATRAGRARPTPGAPVDRDGDSFGAVAEADLGTSVRPRHASSRSRRSASAA